MSFDLKIINGDISLTNDGKVDLVFDNQKLRQDILKILLTKVGENKYHQQYGSEIGALSIGGIVDRNLLEADLESSATIAINRLIALQAVQSKKQYLTPGERIIALLGLQVERDRADPRLYSLYISVQTGKLTQITESITIRIV